MRFRTSRNVYSGRAVLCFVFLWMLIISEILVNSSYLDEILGLCAAVYLLVMWINHKLSKDDTINILLLVAVVLIGIISNIYSGLEVPLFAILVDVLCEVKVLLVFISAKNLFDNDTRSAIVRLFRPWAKFVLYSSFFFAIITQFVDIGMGSTKRYGLIGFNYIFAHNFQFVAIGILMMIVASLDKKPKNLRMLYFCGSIALLLSIKISGILFVVISAFLTLYFKHFRRIKIGTLIAVGIIVLLFGTYQIREYILNENAPRYLFFYYAGRTANTYFPFGSGFATFGSDQAAEVYSQLYVRYGFHLLYGMNPDDTSFLNDNFWPMAIGQFGWIGAALYMIVFIRIFISLGKKANLRPDQKALLYAGYIQYMVHAIGSAVLSSASGMIGFTALALMLGSDNEQSNFYTNKLNIV